jgi:hypothetical protein
MWSLRDEFEQGQAQPVAKNQIRRHDLGQNDDGPENKLVAGLAAFVAKTPLRE